MNLSRSIGFGEPDGPSTDSKLIHYINLKLASLGCPIVRTEKDSVFDEMTAALLMHHRETERLLVNYRCPADQRIQEFLHRYTGDASEKCDLPGKTFILDRHGLGRVLSLPPDEDEFISDLVSSYRVKQGILHNPKSDRRTTEGSFHIAEGGLPVPDDKLAVPKAVFAEMLRRTLSPPRRLMRLPFTSSQDEQAECFVSLLLRPIVCPPVPGFIEEKTMEIRFFAPGSLVSNLDFVESIFGNAGDPFLPENDAGLDVEHWTGHTGCVLLAPHLTRMTKQGAGLPRYEDATERQRRDGMCWKTEDELYNNGSSFKLCCRDASGVIVTIIADNYFGYCKKEVKTQIGFSANLFGLCEEEHAGGALVYPAYDLGEEFSGFLHVPKLDYTFSEAVSLFRDSVDLKPEGYAVDKRFQDIIYVPEDVRFDLQKTSVAWPFQGGEKTIKLLPGKTYVRPSGYKVHMEKDPSGRAWRLVGTVAEGILCHKPCTVSGGGKSEISKPVTDAIIQGPVFVADFQTDFELVAELINRDYSDRFKDETKRNSDSRKVLSPERSLGSVIKLLTPASRDYTKEYNDWLNSIPQYIKELVFMVKRFYKPQWGDQWRDHFGVDIINGTPGNELKCDTRKVVTNYMRVGYENDGSWRTFGLRKDFHPAAKRQMEDDITASVVVPTSSLPERWAEHYARKFVKNCEYRLFQRPDEAIHRGYDKQAESDFAMPGNFLSNYEPLTRTQARELIEDAIGFDKFTPPMQHLILDAAKSDKPKYFVSSAHPRIVEGKPSKNPRYLQIRPDFLHERDTYLAEAAMRLNGRVPWNRPLHTPVTAVVPGRRNNPPEPAARIRSLAVFNPIHYMELPELFMEFICSLTGKSPSTTGAGSEGALTKGPFNALPPIIDVNNALVDFLLTGYDGFVTAAGYVGPKVRVDHDISLLIPEIWSRMTPQERSSDFLARNGYLEKCEDFQHAGKTVLMSRLGYRITARFARTYFGRVFNHPHVVFTDAMLRPETQDLDSFADGIENIVTTQRNVAQRYFNDGSIKSACPPLSALLQIMAEGTWEGRSLNDPELRRLFTREYLLESDWYKQRLTSKQKFDIQLWQRHIGYLQTFLTRQTHADEARRLGIDRRLERAREELDRVKSPTYLEWLLGTIGRDPSTPETN